uniref:CaiB/BaiF CoA transferase family protein n=1 Tax=Desertibaculum subflavum TaxID=2268458 RepID=UPI0034D192C3
MGVTRALEGVRVVDFGQLTAGANTSAMLADLGADVIKVESAGYMDLFRAVGQRDSAPGWWNRSPQFRFTNRNKRGVAIDMKAPAGRKLILDLIAGADVVVENFRRGVLERAGLDYAALAKVNPRIVLASISSQGETGPNRLHGSFGSTLDATGGIAALTGYEDGKPAISGMDVNYPDQVVSLFAAGIVIAAIREAKATGRGVHLDISQREVTSFLIGEQILAAAADPACRAPRRQGNAEAGVALQDCFRGSDGRWLALTLADDADLARCAAAIGGAADRAALAAWCAVRPAR